MNISRQNIFKNIFRCYWSSQKRKQNWANFQEEKKTQRCKSDIANAFPLEVSVNSGRGSWKTQGLGRCFVSLTGVEKIFDFIIAKKFSILKKISSQIYEAKLKEQKG